MIRTRPGEEIGLDEVSFDETFTALYGLAYRVAFRVVGQREEAVDIAQEALARAAARWGRVQDHAAPWVATVAGNLAVDYWRKRRRRDALSLAAPPPASSGAGESSDDRPVERVDLVRALQALPKRQRQVVVLRYLADCSEAEVAASMGCSEGTVKSSASRGLAALRAAAEGGR